MLSKLGPDGMSSDESDHQGDSGIPQFRIMRKEWRSENMTPWLRAFDRLYRDSRFRTGQEKGTENIPYRYTLPGAPQARGRLQPGESTSNRRIVPCLPRNAYDERWMQTLDEFEREELRASPEEYSFLHSPATHL